MVTSRREGGREGGREEEGGREGGSVTCVLKLKGAIQRLCNLNTSDSEIMIREQSDWSVV